MDTHEDNLSMGISGKINETEEELRGKNTKEFTTALKNLFTSKKAKKNTAQDMPDAGFYS